MKSKIYQRTFMGILMIAILFSSYTQMQACSTFKLQHGRCLIYGHNLNEGDLGVPGMIFINKRGIYKVGHTLSELTTKNRLNPSSHQWISRYGSVTFNNFGRDLPDGGLNEVGLYVWEMNENADYPKNTGLPKLNQMSWMQYLLDNFSTTEEAIQAAYNIEIDGWGWHFFIGDKNGNTASVAFINGQVVVHKDQDMPVPALFNTPYDRELEILKYYESFGGHYPIDLNDPKVPRFVKTAKLLTDYTPDKDIVDYGFDILDKIKVNDIPEWSIICDINNKKIYFKTRINPEIKTLDMNKIDFSNNQPTQMLDMDEAKESTELEQFRPFSSEAMGDFIETKVFTILPEQFFTEGGITLNEFKTRFSKVSEAAIINKNNFVGVWETDANESKQLMKLILNSEAAAVSGNISNGKDNYSIDHIHMIGNYLTFTIKLKNNTFVELKAKIIDNKMELEMLGIENSFGSFNLYRKSV